MTVRMHEHPATEEHLAVRVDGEWMERAAEYGPILVFWNDPQEFQIDIEGDFVSYSDDDQHHRPVQLEKYLDEGGVASYLAPNRLPIDTVEVHDVTESEGHKSFYGGSGDER